MSKCGMRFFLICLLFIGSVSAWQEVPYKDGQALRLEGRKISGEAETGAHVYLLIEPEIALPRFDATETPISYRNIIFNYGDSYICGPVRKVKVSIDGQVIQEKDRRDGQIYDWHLFLKGFLTTHYGEVLTHESYIAANGLDLASRMLAAKHSISLERELDDCGDDGVFVFPLPR